MKDSTNNQHASSGGSGVIIPDVEKYTEDLGQQVTNSHMPAVVAVQGPWDFGRSFLMTRLEEYLCGSGDGKHRSISVSGSPFRNTVMTKMVPERFSLRCFREWRRAVPML